LNAESVWDLLNRPNMSQNELAAKAGLTSGYLSQLLNGNRHPSPATRRRLQEVLVAEFDELYIVEAPHDE